MPSGPSRCELGQSVQAETHPCRASGTEAGNQSRQGVQVADLLGYVQVPSTKTVGLNGPPGQVRLM